VYVKLDEAVIESLCCPHCKGDLGHLEEKSFYCEACALEFPGRQVQVGEDRRDTVFDFRLHRPSCCIPQGRDLWGHAQEEYEALHAETIELDPLEAYQKEIDSVREIYTDEYHLEGRILDVGGNQGRLRHFLKE